MELDERAVKLHTLGNTLLTQRKFNDAIAQYEKALEIAPHYASAWYHLAETHEAKNHEDEAFDAYMKAIDLNNAFADIHISSGLDSLITGPLGKAITEYKKKKGIGGKPQAKEEEAPQPAAAKAQPAKAAQPAKPQPQQPPQQAKPPQPPPAAGKPAPAAQAPAAPLPPGAKPSIPAHIKILPAPEMSSAAGTEDIVKVTLTTADGRPAAGVMVDFLIREDEATADSLIVVPGASPDEGPRRTISITTDAQGAAQIMFRRSTAAAENIVYINVTGLPRARFVDRTTPEKIVAASIESKTREFIAGEETTVFIKPRDKYGNVLRSVELKIAAASGGDGAWNRFAELTAVTDLKGIATATFKLPGQSNTPLRFEITEPTRGIDLKVDVKLEPGIPANAEFHPGDANIPAGRPFILAVRITDRFGNPAPGLFTSLMLKESAGGKWEAQPPEDSSTDANGCIVFTIVPPAETGSAAKFAVSASKLPRDKSAAVSFKTCDQNAADSWDSTPPWGQGGAAPAPMKTEEPAPTEAPVAVAPAEIPEPTPPPAPPVYEPAAPAPPPAKVSALPDFLDEVEPAPPTAPAEDKRPEDDLFAPIAAATDGEVPSAFSGIDFGAADEAAAPVPPPAPPSAPPEPAAPAKSPYDELESMLGGAQEISMEGILPPAPPSAPLEPVKMSGVPNFDDLAADPVQPDMPLEPSPLNDLTAPVSQPGALDIPLPDEDPAEGILKPPPPPSAQPAASILAPVSSVPDGFDIPLPADETPEPAQPRELRIFFDEDAPAVPVGENREIVLKILEQDGSRVTGTDVELVIKENETAGMDSAFIVGGVPSGKRMEAVTDDNGTVSARMKASTIAGRVTIIARCLDTSAATEVDITRSEPHRVAFKPEEIEVEPGKSVNIVAAVLDQAGKPVKGIACTFVLDEVAGDRDGELEIQLQSMTDARGEVKVRYNTPDHPGAKAIITATCGEVEKSMIGSSTITTAGGFVALAAAAAPEPAAHVPAPDAIAAPITAPVAAPAPMPAVKPPSIEPPKVMRTAAPAMEPALVGAAAATAGGPRPPRPAAPPPVRAQQRPPEPPPPPKKPPASIEFLEDALPHQTFEAQMARSAGGPSQEEIDEAVAEIMPGLGPTVIHDDPFDVPSFIVKKGKKAVVEVDRVLSKSAFIAGVFIALVILMTLGYFGYKKISSSYHFMQGLKAFNAGNNDAAEPHFLACANLDNSMTEPHSYLSQIHFERAEFYKEQKKFDRYKKEIAMSIHHLNQIIQIKPDDTETLYALGQAYEFQGDCQLATRTYKKLIALDRNYTGAKMKLEMLSCVP